MAQQNRNWRDYRIALAANVAQEIVVSGDYWQVIKATGEVTLEFDQGARVTRGQGTGGPGEYTRVRVTSATSQDVILALGRVSGLTPYDGRAVFGGSINVTVDRSNTQTPLPDVVVPATSALQVAGSDASRVSLSLRISSSAPGDVRVGDATVGAAKGLLVEPGDGITVGGTAAIYVYNTAGAAVTVTLLSERAL